MRSPNEVVEDLCWLLEEQNGEWLHLESQHQPLIFGNGRLESAPGLSLEADFLDNVIPYLGQTLYAGQSAFRFQDVTGPLGPAFKLRRFPPALAYQEFGMPAVIRQQILDWPGLLLLSSSNSAERNQLFAAVVDILNTVARTHIAVLEAELSARFLYKLSMVSHQEIGCKPRAWRVALQSLRSLDADDVALSVPNNPRILRYVGQWLHLGPTTALCLPAPSCAGARQALSDSLSDRAAVSRESVLARHLRGSIHLQGNNLSAVFPDCPEPKLNSWESPATWRLPG